MHVGLTDGSLGRRALHRHFLCYTCQVAQEHHESSQNHCLSIAAEVAAVTEAFSAWCVLDL